MVAVASQAAYRWFTAVADFRAYVRAAVLAEAGAARGMLASRGGSGY